jgi:hypothetical protein
VQHDGAAELVGWLDDVGVAGGLGPVTSFNGGWLVAVACDWGTSL